jgi:putative membrane protein
MTKDNKFVLNVSRGLGILALTAAALTIQADDSASAKSDKSYKTSASAHGSATDKASIIKNAAKMNMTTTKFAELASQKAESPELKQFAQTLKQDHQKAQQDLERIAQKHNITLPTSVDEKCKEEISRLEALSGEEFDREFAKGAIEGHAMAVAHLQQASSGATDTDVRQYTQQMLSKVKEHQRKGRQIAQSVGIDQTTITSLESKAQDSVGGPAATSEGSSESSKDSSSSNSSNESSSQSPDTEKRSIE